LLTEIANRLYSGMGYSIYAIVPKSSAKDVLTALESLKKPSEMFGYAPNDEIDASFAVATNSQLAYRTKSHQRKGVLVGFNYSGPNNAIREFLYSAIAVVAREAGEHAKFGKQRLPAYYYDGQPTALFTSREAAKASKFEEFDVRDDAGMRIPSTDRSMEMFYVVAEPHLQAIRDEAIRLRSAIRGNIAELAGPSSHTVADSKPQKSII